MSKGPHKWPLSRIHRKNCGHIGAHSWIPIVSGPSQKQLWKHNNKSLLSPCFQVFCLQDPQNISTAKRYIWPSPNGIQGHSSRILWQLIASKTLLSILSRYQKCEGVRSQLLVLPVADNPDFDELWPSIEEMTHSKSRCYEIIQITRRKKEHSKQQKNNIKTYLSCH